MKRETDLFLITSTNSARGTLHPNFRSQFSSMSHVHSSWPSLFVQGRLKPMTSQLTSQLLLFQVTTVSPNSPSTRPSHSPQRDNPVSEEPELSHHIICVVETRRFDDDVECLYDHVVVGVGLSDVGGCQAVGTWFGQEPS